MQFAVRRAPVACAIAISMTALGSIESAAQVPVGPETVVTATRLPTPVDRVGNAITVVTEEQIRERQAASVADVLRMVPGVAVSRSGGVAGAQTQIRIRGAEANLEAAIKKLTESAESWKRKYQFLATDQPDAYKHAAVEK